MSWPHYTLLALWAYGFVKKSIAVARDRELSSGTATLAIFILLGSYAVVAYLLHAGGFW